MIEDEQCVEPTPRLSWWETLRYHVEPTLWLAQHWLMVYPLRMGFCHSCGGYFHPAGMALVDKCEGCYARVFGLSGVADPSRLTSPFTSDNE